MIGWMDEQGMELASEKSEIVTVGRRKLKSVEIRVGVCTVSSREKNQKVQDVNGQVSKKSATSGGMSVSERVVSSGALSVITGTSPIDLLMIMRTSIYQTRGEQIAQKECKMIESWQERWQNARVGL